MRAFTSAELSTLQTAQTGVMMDTCVVQVYATSSQDAYGAPVATYTDGAAITCGVEMTGGKESWRANMIATHIDATIRLPIATSIKSTDRIKVTHRFGAAITALVFEVVGAVRRGPSGLQVDVLQVAP